MAQTFSLATEAREVTRGGAKATRKAGKVPVVVYGHAFEPISLSVEKGDFIRLYRKAGQSSLVDLEIGGKSVKVLVHSVDQNPITDEVDHIDFFAVNLKEKTTVHIPFSYVGESPAVKNLGGMFMKDHEHIDIRCLPTEIPHDIEIDISVIEELHGHICVKDLNLDPEKFEIMNLDPETVLCSVVAPTLAEEPTESEEIMEEGGEEAESESTEEEAAEE